VIAASRGIAGLGCQRVRPGRCAIIWTARYLRAFDIAGLLTGRLDHGIEQYDAAWGLSEPSTFPLGGESACVVGYICAFEGRPLSSQTR
jgi:hypothetical protein